MAGCFGGSDIDRWMEGNLNRYLSEEDGEDEVNLVGGEYQVFKDGKYLETFEESFDLDNDDGTGPMIDKLKSIYTKKVWDWYNKTWEQPILVGGTRNSGFYCCDQETFTNIRLYNYDRGHQQKIIENWSMMPDMTCVEENGSFIMTMGKYSIVYDTES